MKSGKLMAIGAACAFTVMADTAVAQGDPDAGSTAFTRCVACHLFDDSGRHRIGPNLADVFGRTAGSVEDFPRYSDALKASGIVWDDATLDQWLTSPEGLVEGALMKMAISDADMRANLIAFLKRGVP